jgi:alginate O-acetyltransferase complex protein AlgJ
MTLSALQPEAPAAEMAKRTVRHRMHIVLAVFFVLALVVPLVGAIFKWDTSGSHENRTMAIFPGKPKNFEQVTTWTDRLMEYYRDHFGFRNALIRGLAVSEFHGGVGLENSQRVVIGSDGWLFLPAWNDENFMAFRGLNPLSEHELDRWQSLLERRYRFFTSRGMKFFVVIPPDKQTIYPEFLPESLGHRYGPSRLDQLIERLRQTHSPVKIIDLRPALLDAKRHEQVYLKTDTHWNDQGAYVGYRTLLAEIRKQLPDYSLPVQSLSSYIQEKVTYSGDLAAMLDLYSEFQETVINLKRPLPYAEKPEFVNQRVQLATEIAGTDQPGARLPRLVTYNDSFMEKLYPFLAFDFSHAYYQWGDSVDGSIAVREKADIVVNEFVERKLCAPPPVDAAGAESIVTPGSD